MATNFHFQLQQQPAIVHVAIGQAEQVLHSGIWRVAYPQSRQRQRTPGFDHSEQLLIDQACLRAFEQVEPDFDRRPVEVAYRAEFASETEARVFVAWTQMFDEYDVWCRQDGCGVLMGFMAPLDEEMLLKASLVVHFAIATAGGAFTGWGVKEDGKHWMTVNRAVLEAPATVN